MKRSAPATSGALSTVLIVCAVGLATRLVFATVLVPRLERAANVAADADHYAELAASLLDRGELGFAPPGASPTSVRGPAFPAWLAVGMLVAGPSPRWIAFWASLPGLIGAGIVAALLSRSHGRTAALAGGLIGAAHPLACFVSARVLPDEAYGAAVLAGLAAWFVAARSSRTLPLVGWSALSGVLLAFASLTRVTALGVAVLVVAIGVFSDARHRRAAAVIVLCATIPIGAWGMRTTALVGRPALVESLPGYNFWLGEAASRFGFASGFGEARARANGLVAREAGAQETASPEFWYGTLTPPEARAFDETLSRAALASVARAPLRYATRCLAGTFWIWTRAETASRTIQYALIAMPLLWLAGVGWWWLFRAPSPYALPAVLIASVIVLHVALYAAICPMARYSVQLYPLLSYLAGVGVAAVFGRRNAPIRA